MTAKLVQMSLLDIQPSPNPGGVPLVISRATPLPNPRLASKFERWAASMQKTIDIKLHPATASQNPTPRRARIIAQMRSEGERLALVQGWLNALADRHRQGTCPYPFALIERREHLFDFAAVYEWVPDKYGTYDPVANQFKYDTDMGNRFRALGINCADDARSALQELLKLHQPNLVDQNLVSARKLRSEGIFHKYQDFFPTPPEMIETMLNLVDLNSAHTVLEPSAGAGDICLAIRERGASVDAYEWNSSLAQALTLFGFPPIGDDFLEQVPRPIYDRVIMNPPFSKDLYIDHVRHAYDFLKPFGQLIAVVPRNYRDSSLKKRREFTDWLDEIGVGEYAQPPNAFNSSDRPCGISVNLIHLYQNTD